MNAIDSKFKKSFSLKVCALETPSEMFSYNHEVNYVINTSASNEYLELATKINKNKNIELVVIEHEFGFLWRNNKLLLLF